MARRRKWIQRAVRHKGALHRMMKIPEGERIPRKLIRSWSHVSAWVLKSRRKSFHGHSAAWWKKAGQRARFALNVPHRRRSR